MDDLKLLLESLRGNMSAHPEVTHLAFDVEFMPDRPEHLHLRMRTDEAIENLAAKLGTTPRRLGPVDGARWCWHLSFLGERIYVTAIGPYHEDEPPSEAAL